MGGWSLFAENTTANAALTFALRKLGINAADAKRGLRPSRSIRFRAMAHPPYFDGVSVRADEEHTIVSNAQPQFVPFLQSFHIARTGLREPVKRGENVHRYWFTGREYRSWQD